MFRDECSGPHCSNVCPEEISLETSSGAVVWSKAARIAIAVIVLLVAVVCLIMKVILTNTISRAQISIFLVSSTVVYG